MRQRTSAEKFGGSNSWGGSHLYLFCLLVCRVLCLCFSVLFLYFCDFVLCLCCFMSFVYVVFWFYFFASLFFCIFVLCFCCSLCVLPLFYVSGPFSHFRVFVFLCVV